MASVNQTDTSTYAGAAVTSTNTASINTTATTAIPNDTPVAITTEAGVPFTPVSATAVTTNVAPITQHTTASQSGFKIEAGETGDAPIEDESRSAYYGAFVTHLDRNATEDDLKIAFSNCGQIVTCRVIRDPITKASKGYGFVNFADEAERDAAVASMENVKINGKQIVVRKGKSDSQSGFKMATTKSGTPFAQLSVNAQLSATLNRNTLARANPDCVIYVGNVPQKMDDDNLKLYLEKLIGFPCVRFRRKDHYAFMTFHNPTEATVCRRTLNGVTIGNYTIIAQHSRRPEDRELCAEYKKCITKALGYCPLDAQQIYMLEKSYRTVYIGTLPPTATRDDLTDAFAKYGEILHTRIVKDQSSGASKYGFVIFGNIQSASSCVAAGRVLLPILAGQEVVVQLSRAPKEIVAAAATNGLTDSDGNPTALFQSIITTVHEQRGLGMGRSNGMAAANPTATAAAAMNGMQNAFAMSPAFAGMGMTAMPTMYPQQLASAMPMVPPNAATNPMAAAAVFQQMRSMYPTANMFGQPPPTAMVPQSLSDQTSSVNTAVTTSTSTAAPGGVTQMMTPQMAQMGYAPHTQMSGFHNYAQQHNAAAQNRFAPY